MASMFANTFSFNKPLNNWNVSNVTDMNRMFRDEALGNEGSIFNQPLANWDVSNVTNMSLMFRNHRKFNQNLVLWNVNNVTDCFLFCENTVEWTLSKPFFNSCIENQGCE
jgi:surface protein